jgi:hypothetical protein
MHGGWHGTTHGRGVAQHVEGCGARDGYVQGTRHPYKKCKSILAFGAGEEGGGPHELLDLELKPLHLKQIQRRCRCVMCTVRVRVAHHWGLGKELGMAAGP